MTETKTFVRYYMPGAFASEEGTREVPGRDPKRIARELPASAFAFEFYDKIVTETSEGGTKVKLTSEARNRSGCYYIDGEKLGQADVAALPGDHRVLLDNMRGNGWDVVVRCRTGNFQPLRPEDFVVASS